MYETLKERFAHIYGKKPQYLFRAPGRTEISGNHTDHQHGTVLAGSVDRYTAGAVALNGTDSVNVSSEGYPSFSVSLNDLERKAEEEGTSKSLVRGILYRFASLGKKIPGFDLCVSSEVLSGSGLSSSAAYEVLVATIVAHLTESHLSKKELALFSQYAENVYFGKPSGLMDQMSSAVGNIVFIDFRDPSNAVVKELPFDLKKAGYALCIIDSGAGHADLTDAYASIPYEMKEICRHFGKEYLRDVDEEAFYLELPDLRKKAGDRACLRAMHIFDENKRVLEQKEALLRNDTDTFLRLVKESGQSSYDLLQNVIPEGYVKHQELAVALAVAKKALKGKGAYRVHGGGFAGTIQAFVPEEELPGFIEETERILGKGSCHVMTISSGGSELYEEL